MVKININFKKKDLFLLSAIMVFLVGVGFAIAWGSGNPSVMGHDASELTGVCKTDGTGCPASLGGGSCSFGAWQDVTAAAASGVVQGPAASDGFVLAHTEIGADGYWEGYTGSSNPPTTLVSKDYQGWGGGTVGLPTMPVKKNDYWRTVITYRGGLSGTKIYWIPLNCGGVASSGLTNCVWTSYGTCGAASGGQVLCPSDKVVNAVDIVGCTSASPPCDDARRCEKTRLYCCNLS